ncbi:hypothetical protein ACU8KH_05396 [Lachancea thermotolerans]|uniref:KLTH0G18260p n=1 Tax=Lachancea thermotolerans (strain ATCC 56472 / CBS 6340 / NRRL Y-8284) TaxID=559295 RepID=C5DNM1_LACTC|nr:KLTH0G18260p [Lachancea thermotolerans CBS 6340]CAR25382.1 KLTH0G18260p [Lachancea thermotolerans CBS 6340]
MTEASAHKRSPTTPSTPGIWNDARAKKLKSAATQSPTKPRRSRDATVEELTRQQLINSRELQRVNGLVRFLELERKFQT